MNNSALWRYDMEHVVALAGIAGLDDYHLVLQRCRNGCIADVLTMDAMEPADLRIAFPDGEDLDKLVLARFVVGMAFEHENPEILNICQILSKAGGISLEETER